MTHETTATILARSLLAAGYNPNPGPRVRWTAPDGYPATRADLQAHIIQAYHGDDRDPFIPYLTSGRLWPLVDRAATALVPARP